MNIINVENIDFSVCSLVKGNNNCGRRIFLNKLDGMYYKIWDENYSLWGNNIGALFFQAVYSDFFDGIAKIEAIIFSSSGNCVGYISPPFKNINRNVLVTVPNDLKFYVLELKEKQDKKYRIFFDKLCLNISRTNLFYYDLVMDNIGIDNEGNYKLLDLNSIINVSRFNTIPPYHRRCIPEDYKKFILEISRRRLEVDMNLVKKAWSMSTGGMNHKPYCGAFINGKIFEGERPWEERWPLIKTALNWEGLKILDLGTCMGLIPIYLSKYCNISLATGTDFNSYHLEAANLIKKAFKISEESVNFIHIDLDKDNYEEILGFEYDVVFCLSLIRWIKDKERLYKYLSNFSILIIEPHDLDGDVIPLFRKLGFSRYRYLGNSKIGKNFSQTRDLFLFQKDD